MSLKRASPVRETEPMPFIHGTLPKLPPWLSRYYNIKWAFNKWCKLVRAEDFGERWFLQTWMNWLGRSFRRSWELDQRGKLPLWL